MRQYPSTPSDWATFPVVSTETELLIGGWQVMQTWERPLMDFMAREVTVNKGCVLEVGFGMGISADAIMRFGCRNYTVIEAHPSIAENARQWGNRQSVPVNVIEGLWQETVPLLTSQFDGILFDTFPLSELERHKNHYPFISVAPNLLRPNGVLTYFSDETLEFRPDHLKLLLTHFSEVKLTKVSGLAPFPNCDYWHEPYMVIPVAKMVGK